MFVMLLGSVYLRPSGKFVDSGVFKGSSEVKLNPVARSVSQLGQKLGIESRARLVPQEIVRDELTSFQKGALRAKKVLHENISKPVAQLMGYQGEYTDLGILDMVAGTSGRSLSELPVKPVLPMTSGAENFSFDDVYPQSAEAKIVEHDNVPGLENKQDVVIKQARKQRDNLTLLVAQDQALIKPKQQEQQVDQLDNVEQDVDNNANIDSFAVDHIYQSLGDLQIKMQDNPLRRQQVRQGAQNMPIKKPVEVNNKDIDLPEREILEDNSSDYALGTEGVLDTKGENSKNAAKVAKAKAAEKDFSYFINKNNPLKQRQVKRSAQDMPVEVNNKVERKFPENNNSQYPLRAEDVLNTKGENSKNAAEAAEAEAAKKDFWDFIHKKKSDKSVNHSESNYQVDATADLGSV
jgi:hypothetical protein